jgi:hypothetical protein
MGYLCRELDSLITLKNLLFELFSYIIYSLAVASTSQTVVLYHPVALQAKSLRH